MYRSHWIVAALLGVLVASVVALVPVAWSALAIGSGALVATVVHAGGSAPRKRYAVLGTTYCLALAAVARLVVFPGRYGDAPWLALATLGTVSALVVGTGLLGRRLLGRVPDPIPTGRDGRSLAGTIRLGASAVGTVRTLIAVGGTVARLAGVLVAGLVGTLAVGGVAFVLDGLGVTATVPWIGGSAVDLVLVLFVAAVLAWFYVLAAVRTLVVAVAAGVDAGRSVGAALGEARRRAEDRSE